MMSRRLWPGVRLEVHTLPGLTGPLQAGVDLCVTLGTEPARGPFRAFRLAEVDVALFASPEYLAAHAPIESVADLDGHALLIWQAPGEPIPEVLPHKLGPDVPIDPVYVTDNADVLHGMVSAHSGVAFMPHRDPPPDHFGEFVPVLLESIGSARTLRLLVSNAVVDVPRIKLLIEVIEQLIPEFPAPTPA